jgi:uncharacterized SAM-binding protein YcdF (DUF218 family)
VTVPGGRTDRPFVAGRDAPAVPTDPDPTPVVPIAAIAVRGEHPLRVVGRWSLRIGAVVFALACLYYAVTLYQVWSTGRSDSTDPVDAIVVMGAAQYDGRPSPQLAARLDHVAELWPTGVAPLVVVTGGNRPGDRFTEAETSASYLERLGVPAGAILREDSGTSSFESLEAVAAILLPQGLDRVLIVTDPYHALRSRMIAAEVGLDPDVSPTETSVVTGATELQRHLGEAAAVSVGRIVSFDRLAALLD